MSPSDISRKRANGRPSAFTMTDVEVAKAFRELNDRELDELVEILLAASDGNTIRAALYYGAKMALEWRTD